VKTPGVTLMVEPKIKFFPFASSIVEMKPSTHVTPPAEVDAQRAACDGAFAKACRFSGGRDLVEEMVVPNFWPHGKHRPKFTLVRMKLLVFGSTEGEFYPCFNLRRAEDETDEEFVSFMERFAPTIHGEISEEYLSRRAIGGTMPRLNRVFEEMIPDKIFKYVEEKVAKATQTATMPALTAWAEAKKRKAVGALKTISKKKKGAAAKVVDAEEMTKSGYGGSSTAQAGIEV
jgi:hypothetical protein